ncbi:amino acid ABC transporter permease [Catenulispora sp. NF23]|uniref:Amino acid ABC transporter permease n=1 Tax=Catenulispora pinistramenti TaxID=2705254 RepID=A0ABS5L400_9ACTN|nr:amino acid ABC transporter permease [Catenulispora pinistramenti]MBS2552955.1 amino acid ABC transporter permease [Catenulispora pinistramenti]
MSRAVTEDNPTAGADDALAAAAVQPNAIRAVRVRRPGRWISAIILLLFVAMFAHMLVSNKNFGWDLVRQWLFWHTIIQAIWVTLELTVYAMLIGIVGGVLLAVMRLSSNPVSATAAWLYTWFFRGTPVLVQLLFWNNIAALVGQQVGFGVPFGPQFFHLDTNSTITAFTAAVLALGLNEAAYMSEIVRAGILSVDEGQSEAAASLGMRRGKIMSRIVLPQAMRVIIPPTGNEVISMLKTSSLASVIGVVELTDASESAIHLYFKAIPFYVVASLWYLFFTTVLSIGQYYIERYYARGSTRNLPPTPFQKLLRANLLFRTRRRRAEEIREALR